MENNKVCSNANNTNYEGTTGGASFETMQFNPFEKLPSEVEQIVSKVMKAMGEKGYNPVNQLVGFIISGDPTYVTSHNGARSLVMKIDRDTLLEEIVQYYLDHNERLDLL